MSLPRSDNQEPRVDSGSTSTNGLTLFKATSSIVCKTIQHILFAYPNLVVLSFSSSPGAERGVGLPLHPSVAAGDEHGAE